MTTQSGANAPMPRWEPPQHFDLPTASRDAFGDILATLAASIQANTEANTRPPLPFTRDGWYDIDPQMCEAALHYSAGNRVYDFTTVKNFAADMVNGDWQPTGETIICSGGLLDEGHHRLLAGLLSRQSFRCYVVTSGQRIENGFVYLNSGKKRTPADALHIAGLNGSGPVIAKVISTFAIRYDLGLLGIAKQPRMKTPNSREVLKYAYDHRDLADAAQWMLGTHGNAVSVIGSKAAAVFFAWRVIRAYDAVVLGDFCTKFGSGAMLDEDSPLLAARNKLTITDQTGQPMTDRERLAYVSKAFLMWVKGDRMQRAGRNRAVLPLGLELDEAFPRIERPVDADAPVI